MKRPLGIIAISIFGAFLTVAGQRIISRQILETAQDRRLGEICQVITGEAQASSYFHVIENANSMFLAGFPETKFFAQVREGATVLGRPLQTDERGQYRQVPCEVLGRSGLSVQFFIGRASIFDKSFALGLAAITILYALLGLTLGKIKKTVIRNAQRRFSAELKSALGLTPTPVEPGFFGKWFSSLAESDGNDGGASLKTAVEELKGQIFEQQQSFASLREQQVRTEMDLRRNEKFIEVVRQVRHDIRGPLQTLIVMMEEVQNRGFQRTRLSSIVQTIQDMIEDLSTKEEMFDQSRAGESNHAAEALIQEIIQQKRIIFEPKHVTIKLEISDQYLGLVNVNPSHFRRVIANLLQNAFEAMPDTGGNILVRTEKCSGRLMISIIDNGCGIPASIKPKVFIPEFTFGKPRGSGLGLSHARSCVEKWHGIINLDSTEGIGTTVIIDLPLADESARFIASSPLSSADVNIVLDDEIESYERIAATLTGPSIYCGSISEFESRNSTLPPDLKVQYVFDFNLKDPEKRTGLDALRAVNSPYPRILATNDYDRPEVVQASLEGIYILPKVFLA